MRNPVNPQDKGVVVVGMTGKEDMLVCIIVHVMYALLR